MWHLEWLCDECKLKFLELEVKRSYWFIIFKIENQEVVVEKLEDFADSLPANGWCYAVYDLYFIIDEDCQKSKIFSLHGDSTFP